MFRGVGGPLYSKKKKNCEHRIPSLPCIILSPKSRCWLDYSTVLLWAFVGPAGAFILVCNACYAIQFSQTSNIFPHWCVTRTRNSPVHNCMKSSQAFCSGSEAAVNFVLIQTLLLLKRKSENYYVK